MARGDNAAAGPSSATGVVRAGNQFQDLAVLIGALQLLRPTARFEWLEVEAKGVGNLDDLVLHSADGSGVYSQIKYATKPADLVDEKYLLGAEGNDSSILQKLSRGWTAVTAGTTTRPVIRLVTNRALDRSDPLLRHVDGRSELLMPYAETATPRSLAGKAVTKWAAHLECSRDELLDMLRHLQFRTGRSVSSETDVARILMDAAGLDDTDQSVGTALAAVNDWIIDGRRTVTRSDVADMVDGLGLRRRKPSAILSVQAIDLDPLVAEADWAVDWVGLYDGVTPRERVVPRDSASWELMAADIDVAAAKMQGEKVTSTLLRGSMRQATFFRVGSALPATRQHEISYHQGQTLWSSDSIKRPVGLRENVVEPSADSARCTDLIVVIGLSTDPTTEVIAYAARNGLDGATLLTITPDTGPDDQSVGSAGHAVAFAEAARNAVRAQVARQRAAKVHLFLAGPGGFALLLGHRWNRVAPTTVYEHLGAGRGYVPAFQVNG